MKIITILLGIVGFGIAFVITMAISFLPTIIAFIRGNTYKRQVLIYQLIMTAGSVVVGICVFFCSMFIPILGSIASTVWGLFSLVAWGYILLNAIRDDEMTILSMIGINI